MTDHPSRAEAFAARRGLVCLLFSLASAVFTATTVVSLQDGPLHPARVLLWAIWLLVPLAWVFGRGGWRFSARERAIISDELVQSHQHRAARVGMLAMMAGLLVAAAGTFGFLTVPAWWPVAVLGGAIAAAGIAFGVIELRNQ